jgi:hypothetical protein
MTSDWRLVPGWPDYRVDREGRIESRRPMGAARVAAWRAIQPFRHKDDPYPRVELVRGPRWDREYCNVAMHTLVAAAWVGPRPPGQIVLHADDNPANFRAGNLRYGTHLENGDDRAFRRTGGNAKSSEKKGGACLSLSTTPSRN